MQNLRRHCCQSAVTAGRPPSMRAPQTFCPRGPLLPPRTQQSRWCTQQPLEPLLLIHPTGLKPPYPSRAIQDTLAHWPFPQHPPTPVPTPGDSTHHLFTVDKELFPRQLCIAPLHVDTPYLPPPVSKHLTDRACLSSSSPPSDPPQLWLPSNGRGAGCLGLCISGKLPAWLLYARGPILLALQRGGCCGFITRKHIIE